MEETAEVFKDFSASARISDIGSFYLMSRLIPIACTLLISKDFIAMRCVF